MTLPKHPLTQKIACALLFKEDILGADIRQLLEEVESFIDGYIDLKNSYDELYYRTPQDEGSCI